MTSIVSSATNTQLKHGSNTTYACYGCRCELCRNAHSRHMNLWRMGRTDRLVDATGTHRRIEALTTLGWSRAALSVRLGHQRDYFAKQVGQRWVTGRIAAKVAVLYDELCMTPAPDTCSSRRVRAIARRKGYVSPLAWDDDAIDDPEGRPSGAVNDSAPDAVVVDRILAGDYALARSANRAERVEVVRRWRAAGRSTNELGRLTGWEPHRYIDHSEKAA